MNLRNLLVSSLLGLTLAACAGPMDSALVTDKGEAAYFKRLEPLFAQMTPAQQEAFNWSVSDLSIDAINQRYPGASPRHIINAEAALVLKTHADRINTLQPLLQQYRRFKGQLQQLRSDNIQFRIDQDFHGLQPWLKADFHNGSPLSFSTTGWSAELYLDGSQTPAASYTFTLNHRNRGGFLPDESESHDIHLGFVTGDANWMTLEVRNARQRHIQIRPTAAGSTDLGERAFALIDPRPEIERLQAVIAAAEKYRGVP